MATLLVEAERGEELFAENPELTPLIIAIVLICTSKSLSWFWILIFIYITTRDAKCHGYDGYIRVKIRVQLQCNVYEKGGKYTEAQPRCTCPQFESTLLRSLWWITECNSNAKFTRREASTPRRSRGVLVLPTSQLCIQVGEVHVQLLMDLMLVHWRFCYCKRVRIDWAEWLSEPIWNTNAMRVSEYIILPKDAW